MDGYRRRIMDSLLEKKLQAKGAVLIEGPKWCGKTTTAEEIAASKILLARTDVKNNFKSLLEIDTDAALSGDTPMLIDEWQTVPKLWDAVRYTVVYLRNGQYGLIEVKLGGETLINEGVETLTSLAKQIDTTRMKAPAFKMILTATGEHAYRRPEDGIYIVPIGCLKQ